MLIGIDESGRGCVIGPLVVCGVVIPHEKFQNKLIKLGVKDSKKITGDKRFEKRAELAYNIRKLTCDNVLVEIATAAQIDEYRRKFGTLDDLERIMASKIIRLFSEKYNIDKVICDGQMFNPLKNKYPFVQCFNKADDLWPVVSAASICAKNTRDSHVKMIMNETAGGGYPNKDTWEWIKEDYEKNGKYSDHIRTSWSWFKKMCGEKSE